MSDKKNEGKNIDLEEIKSMNIYQKMLAIEDELGVIAKNLSVGDGKFSYKAVGERDVIDNVKPLLVKYRVYAYPISREVDDKGQFVNQGKYGDKTSFYFHYKNIMRFVNIDKVDEFIDIPSYSTGIDTADKADGKGMTYGDKYAFMKAFMMSTGDDPDKDASPEGGYEAMATKAQLEQIYNHASELTEKLKEFNISKPSELVKLTAKQASELLKGVA